jgi:hypothetical protein
MSCGNLQIHGIYFLQGMTQFHVTVQQTKGNSKRGE